MYLCPCCSCFCQTHGSHCPWLYSNSNRNIPVKKYNKAKCILTVLDDYDRFRGELKALNRKKKSQIIVVNVGVHLLPRPACLCSARPVLDLVSKPGCILQTWAPCPQNRPTCLGYRRRAGRVFFQQGSATPALPRSWLRPNPAGPKCILGVRGNGPRQKNVKKING